MTNAYRFDLIWGVGDTWSIRVVSESGAVGTVTVVLDAMDSSLELRSLLTLWALSLERMAAPAKRGVA